MGVDVADVGRREVGVAQGGRDRLADGDALGRLPACDAARRSPHSRARGPARSRRALGALPGFEMNAPAPSPLTMPSRGRRTAAERAAGSSPIAPDRRLGCDTTWPDAAATRSRRRSSRRPARARSLGPPRPWPPGSRRRPASSSCSARGRPGRCRCGRPACWADTSASRAETAPPSRCGPNGRNRTGRRPCSRDRPGTISASSQGIMSAPKTTPSRSGSTASLRSAGVGAGQIGRREGELDVAAHHLQALPRPDVLLRVEVDHLAADGRRKVARRLSASAVQGDPPHAAAPLDERRPEGLLADADRTDHAHPGDHDFPLRAISRNSP